MKSKISKEAKFMKKERKKKLRKFKAYIYGEDQNGNTYQKYTTIYGKTPRQAYSKLKSENGVIDIEYFKEIK